MSSRFLAAQLPEFDAEFAPGANPVTNPVLDPDAAEDEPLLPATTPPTKTEKSAVTTVRATHKPSTLAEAFQLLWVRLHFEL